MPIQLASQKANLGKSGVQIVIFIIPPSSRKIHFLYRFHENEKTKNITSFLKHMRKNWCSPKYKILLQKGDSEFSAQEFFFFQFQDRPLQKTITQNISPEIFSTLAIWKSICWFTILQHTLPIQILPSKKKVKKHNFCETPFETQKLDCHLNVCKYDIIFSPPSFR